MYTLRSIYGVDQKDRRHVLLQTQDADILLHGGRLDAGFESLLQAVPCDAVVLTTPNASSLKNIVSGGDVPIYCPECMVDSFAPENLRLLPDAGMSDVLGIGVLVGRTGRGPGSGWIRFDIGDGLLHTPVLAEDKFYSKDTLPKAGTVLVNDALDTKGGGRGKRLEFLAPQLLAGNAVVFATRLKDILDISRASTMIDGGMPHFFLDEAVKADIDNMIADPASGLHENAARSLKKLSDASPVLLGNSLPLNAVFMTCLGAGAQNGELSQTAADILKRYEKSNEHRFLFVGRVGDHPLAERLVSSGRAEVFPLPTGACPNACRSMLRQADARQVLFFGRYEHAAANVVTGLEGVAIIGDDGDIHPSPVEVLSAHNTATPAGKPC